MLQTAFTRLVGVQNPIMQAPMGGGISTPELVAAVSNAGGLGMLAAGGLPPAVIVKDLAQEAEACIRNLQNALCHTSA